jgi:hypothetical protein
VLFRSPGSPFYEDESGKRIPPKGDTVRLYIEWKNPEGKLRAVGATFQGTGAQSVFYRTALCTLMLEVYYRFLPGTASGK